MRKRSGEELGRGLARRRRFWAEERHWRDKNNGGRLLYADD
jgi:hypothetical protein